MFISWLVSTLGFIRSSSLAPSSLRIAAPACLGVRLAVGMHLQQPEQPFHHLDARGHVGGLQGDVGEPVDLDARRNLHHHAGLLGYRVVALGGGGHEGGHLELQAVQKNVVPPAWPGAVVALPGSCC